MQLAPRLAQPVSEVLAQPQRLGALTLPNRIVMAPMTRECAPEGVPTAAMADYYGRRADGGTGLIVTEGAAPNEEGRFGSAVPRLHGADAMAGWERIVARVHTAGTKIFAQIWHVGAFSPSMIGMKDSLAVERLSPSALASPGKPFGREMSAADIAHTIRDFGESARLAREAGFDGVEIHAAHGYLPDQFFWAQTNSRADRYGGDLTARSRFAAEIVAACKAAAGSAFPVTLRLSQWKQHDYMARVVDGPEQLSTWLAALNASGVDAYHVSTRRFWEPAFPGSDETFAGWVRRLSRRPVIAVGSAMLTNDFKAPLGKERSDLLPGGLERIEDGLCAGQFDLMAFGRAMLANPDLAEHLLRGDLHGLQSFDRKYLDRLV